MCTYFQVILHKRKHFTIANCTNNILILVSIKVNVVHWDLWSIFASIIFNNFIFLQFSYWNKYSKIDKKLSIKNVALFFYCDTRYRVLTWSCPRYRSTNLYLCLIQSLTCSCHKYRVPTCSCPRYQSTYRYTNMFFSLIQSTCSFPWYRVLTCSCPWYRVLTCSCPRYRSTNMFLSSIQSTNLCLSSIPST